MVLRILIWALALAPIQGDAEPGLIIGGEVETYADDGRTPISALMQEYLRLVDHGWKLHILYVSQPAGATEPLPIIALYSPRPGRAAWFLGGVHGEEPAGPMALAGTVETLAELGDSLPVVVMPLLNPHGYARNWRYLNRPDWAVGAEVQSVGDSSHRLPAPGDGRQARVPCASSPEAAAIVDFVLQHAQEYPPRWSIDLHEDALLDAGYVYSQGRFGADDPLAALAVATLREAGVPVQMSGETRFGEPITNGIIGPVIDSSIDELMSAEAVIIGNHLQAGPAAHTVLVFETPAEALPLAQRVAAHEALIRAIAAALADSSG